MAVEVYHDPFQELQPARTATTPRDGFVSVQLGTFAGDVLQKSRGDLLFERSRSSAFAKWVAQREEP
ncbi:hypothetical protein PC116_g11486 [Phytophthora cactorum]|uniref:Uncharacterized protein n=1 Tax=Phytophthora cactorum TaxID=29920 RepID=A0A8T1L0U7_9STRA|nr:hypothetical protein Pcac1_g11133 [Phytophthora cactorum]KAG2912245.1 hypothetical protein PC114_g8987 [Phytophthora cactorum]KAG2945033.1 hypothetical protein PC117_g8786 [Phytophthora cactorum]KAG3024456.1 hypothetical protein PC119_g8489 [Phytophthora cactorum]KAG3175668.1 hypothetical protein C6341_g9373 [Phytophthora cactorum]